MNYIIGKKFYSTTKSNELPDEVRVLRLQKVRSKENANDIVEFQDQFNKVYELSIDDFYNNYNALKPCAVFCVKTVSNRMYGENYLISLNPYDLNSNVNKTLGSLVFYAKLLETMEAYHKNQYTFFTEFNNQLSRLDVDRVFVAPMESHKDLMSMNTSFVLNKKVIYLYQTDTFEDLINLLYESGYMNELNTKIKELFDKANNVFDQGTDGYKEHYRKFVPLEVFLKHYKEVLTRILNVIEIDEDSKQLKDAMVTLQWQAINFGDLNKSYLRLLDCIKYQSMSLDILSQNHTALQFDDQGSAINREFDLTDIQLKEYDTKDDLESIFGVDNTEYQIYMVRTNDKKLFLLKIRVKDIQTIIKEDPNNDIMNKEEYNKMMNLINQKK